MKNAPRDLVTARGEFSTKKDNTWKIDNISRPPAYGIAVAAVQSITVVSRVVAKKKTAPPRRTPFPEIAFLRPASGMLALGS
jgi:hypothetical protein